VKNIVAAISKCFRTGPEPPFPREQAPPGGATAPLIVPVLLGSSHDDDRRTVASFLEGSRWTLVQARSWPDLLQIPLSVICPVILCDLAMPGYEWQTNIFRLATVLWDEVVRHGGFDVLTRPLSKPDILSTLDFAYIHWKSGRTNLQNTH